MISLLLIALAGVFKALADTLADHFSISRFQSLNPRFWEKNESWKWAQKLPLTNYPLDAWHLAGSGMILCFCLAAVFHDLPWHPLLQLAAYGAVNILSFNLFYNLIFKK